MRYRTVTAFARSEGCHPGDAIFATIEIEGQGQKWWGPPIPSDYGSISYGPWIEWGHVQVTVDDSHRPHECV